MKVKQKKCGECLVIKPHTAFYYSRHVCRECVCKQNKIKRKELADNGYSPLPSATQRRKAATANRRATREIHESENQIRLHRLIDKVLK